MDFKQVVMDYGPAIGPILAFFLGILAIYVKTLIDRRLERWKTAKRLSNLKRMIKNSTPPPEFLDMENSVANRTGNWLNVEIFINHVKILINVVLSMESDALLNGSTNTIRAFHATKIKLNYLYVYCNELSSTKYMEGVGFNFEGHVRLLTKKEFDNLHSLHQDLLRTQSDPSSFFSYNKKDGMWGRSLD